MNCRHGDLAVIIKTRFKPNLLGAFVRVVGPYDGPYEWDEPAWWIDFAGAILHSPDSYLQPIRGIPVTSKRETETI